MFRAHRAHHQERQIVSIQPLVAVGGRVVCRSEVNGVHFRPAHDTATNTEWQLPGVVLTQFFSPDDEHDVLETYRVKNINKYIEKNCVSRWSFTKNRYMMHGQQNIKFWKEMLVLLLPWMKHWICMFYVNFASWRMLSKRVTKWDMKLYVLRQFLAKVRRDSSDRATFGRVPGQLLVQFDHRGKQAIFF